MEREQFHLYKSSFRLMLSRQKDELYVYLERTKNTRTAQFL